MKIKSIVMVEHENLGYFITVKDDLTTNKLAITRKELESIVRCGRYILNHSNCIMKSEQIK